MKITNNNIPDENDIYNKNDEYDAYDIVDFLEIDYLEYLNSIPEMIWSKYKREIESKLLKVNDLKIIEFVVKKIKIDSYNYIKKNLQKMNFELFKFLINNEKKNLIDKLIKYNLIKNIHITVFKHHNLDFNKYVCEIFYEDIKNNNNVQNINNNVQNNNTYIVVKKKISYDKEIKSMIELRYFSHDLPIYEDVFYYYIELFNIDISIKNKLIKQYTDLYIKIFTSYSIYSFEKIIKLNKLLEINDENFINNILFRDNHSFSYSNKYVILYICKLGDIELFFQIINKFNIEKKYYTKNDYYMVKQILLEATLSKNNDFVLILYNYFKFNIKIDFTIKLLSNILVNIILHIGSNRDEYDTIIYEFLNLGAIITGYGVYTEYIESIKLLNNNNQIKLIK